MPVTNIQVIVAKLHCTYTNLLLKLGFNVFYYLRYSPCIIFAFIRLDNNGV